MPMLSSAGAAAAVRVLNRGPSAGDHIQHDLGDEQRQEQQADASLGGGGGRVGHAEAQHAGDQRPEGEQEDRYQGGDQQQAA